MNAESQPAPIQIKVITAPVEGGRVNAVLVMGREDAVLIDTQFRLSDVHRLVADILESGKRLTTVYITHSHPDHYFGLPVIKQAFPQAKIVALPATIARIEDTVAGKLIEFKAMLGSNVIAEPLIPGLLEGGTIALEDERLEVRGGLQGDEADNSYVWIPSLKAIICGDIIYSGIYPWTLETTPEERKAWIGVLDEIAALEPSTVVAGHKNPELADSAASIHFTKDYLVFFDATWPTAKDPEELQATIRGKFPGLEVDAILKWAAETALAAR